MFNRPAVFNIRVLSLILVSAVFGLSYPATASDDNPLCQEAFWTDASSETIQANFNSVTINDGICPHGETVLFQAARFAPPSAITALITLGADINHLADDGCSAICRAVMWEHDDAITTLAAAGADLTLTDDKGVLMADRLLFFGDGDAITTLATHSDILDRADQNTLWQIALHRYDETLVDLLLQRGEMPKTINVESQNNLYRILDYALLVSPSVDTVEAIISSSHQNFNYHLSLDSQTSTKNQNLENIDELQKIFSDTKKYEKKLTYLAQAPSDTVFNEVQDGNVFAIVFGRSMRKLHHDEFLEKVFADHEKVTPFSFLKQGYRLELPLHPTIQTVNQEEFKQLKIIGYPKIEIKDLETSSGKNLSQILGLIIHKSISQQKQES